MYDEKKLIAAVIKSREAWTTLITHVQSAELGPDTSTLLALATDYYKRDSTAQSVDISLVSSLAEKFFPNPKHFARIKALLGSLPDVSAMNLVHAILDLKRHNLGLKLSNALLTNSKETSRLLSEYSTLLAQASLDSLSEGELDVIESFKVQDLVQKSFDPKGLIPLKPLILNNRLGGGLRPGHHILIFAPTEMGKTLLVIDNLAGWAEAGIKALYVGNEDPIEDIQMRFITRVCKRPKADILEKPEVAQKLLEKRGYENIIFAPLAPGSFPQIERLVDKYQPKVVVLDQLHNLNVDSDSGTQAKETQGTYARNMAKSKHVAVVSVTQAADSASGKRIFNRGDVYGSNVGIPGQTDAMIGFGGTEDDEKQNIRWFSFPKNKLSGDHESLQAEINPQLSMVLE